MQDYKKLIVPLGLQNNDAGAILWATRIAKHTDADQILFIYTSGSNELPPDLQTKLPSDSVLKKEMSDLVTSHACPDCSVDKFKFAIDCENPTQTALLKAIDTQVSDCVIIGKDAFGDSMHIKLARKAPCSVMSVPSNPPQQLNKLMLANDFSQYASEALDLAIQIAHSKHLPSIDSVHVYSLAPGHDRITIPEETQIAIAEDFAVQHHKEHLEQCDAQGIQINAYNYFNTHTTRTLLNAADTLESDLIVVSCRGKNALTAWLLGSVAENLLDAADIPVLASKIRGTGQNFLNVLLGN